MFKRCLGCCAVLSVCGMLVGFAEVKTTAPIPPTQVAPLELITADLEEKIEELKKQLTDADAYSDREEVILRTGAVIACLAQAAVEHDGAGKLKYQPAALRDAGITVRDAADHAEAAAGLQAIESAWHGKATGEFAKLHPWNDLIGMYDLMEEMNDRNGGLSRSLRRSRGKLSEKLNASTNAVLAIAMLADHEYVFEEDDLPEWKQLSIDYQQAMTKLITAIENKDQAQIAEFYKAGNRACDKCHESFRD